MKNFNIQRLALVAVIVMVCTESSVVNTKHLLNLIHEEAENLSKQSVDELQNAYIAKISGGVTICVKEIFCMAEKALNATTSIQLKTEKLYRHLHAYNNKTGITNCTIDCNVTIPFKKFLSDIIKCSANGSHNIKQPTTT